MQGHLLFTFKRSSSPYTTCRLHLKTIKKITMWISALHCENGEGWDLSVGQMETNSSLWQETYMEKTWKHQHTSTKFDQCSKAKSPTQWHLRRCFVATEICCQGQGRSHLAQRSSQWRLMTPRVRKANHWNTRLISSFSTQKWVALQAQSVQVGRI